MKHLEIQFTLGDQSWTLDIGKFTVDDYIELKRLTGLGVARLLPAVDDMDPLVVKAMLWMARCNAGEKIAFTDPKMSFTFQELRMKVLRDDTAADAEAKPAVGAPGPTKAPRAPRTRKKT